MTELPLAWAPGAPAPARAAKVSPADAVVLLDRRAAEREAARWGSLARRAAEENPFFEPDILLPALAHLDPGDRVRLAVVEGSGGAIAAAAPVIRRRLGRLAPALSVWTHDFGPLGTPLIDAGQIEEGASGLVAASREAPLVCPDLPTEGSVAAALCRAATARGRGVMRIAADSRAVIDRAEGQAIDLKKCVPTRRRKELARQLRRLAEQGAVTWTAPTDPAEQRDAFEEFLRLEAAGWKGREGTALASNPNRAAFARELVLRRSGRRRCDVAALRLNGEPLAMLVSFRGRATVATWKVAYDERFSRFSPGAQLMLEVGMRLMADPEIRHVDSLAAPDHPMIDHLWRDRMAVGTLVVGPTREGYAFGAGIVAARLERHARKMASRLRGGLRRRKKEQER